MKVTWQFVLGATLLLIAVSLIINELSKQKLLKPVANIVHQYYVKSRLANIVWQIVLMITGILITLALNK